MRFFVLRTLKIATSIRIPDYRPSYSCLFTPLIECIPCLQADVMHSMDEFIIVKKALPRNGNRLCLRIRSDTLIHKSACFAVNAASGSSFIS